MDSKWSKQEACFACAIPVCLTGNHYTIITSGEGVFLFKAYCTVKWAWQLSIKFVLFMRLWTIAKNLEIIGYNNFTFPNIIKSIGSRMKHFLILCQSLSRLALWTVCTAVKIETVDSSLTTGFYYIFRVLFAFFFKNKLFCMYFAHDLHDF